MTWNAEEKARNYLEALEQLNDNRFAVADEYWKKQQQKEIKEDITKKEREAINDARKC